MWGYVAAGAAALFAASWAFARGRVEGLKLGLQADDLLEKAKAEAGGLASAMPRPSLPNTMAAKPSPADIEAAEQWSSGMLPGNLPLSTRMDLMRGIIPMHKWPPFAVRVARWLAMMPGGV